MHDIQSVGGLSSRNSYMENDTKKELEEDKKTAPVSEKKEEASSKKRDNPNKKTSVWTSLLG